jgi:hypothetical protein
MAYHDSTIERSLVEDGVNPPRVIRSWHMSKRLTTIQLQALLDVWLLVGGGLTPLYFYPKFSDYDATGSSPTGRVVTVFRGPWSHSLSLGRHNVPSLDLLEVG